MTTTRRNRLAQLVVGISAVAVFATSTSAAIVRVTRDEPTAEELLAEARRFVVEHKTVAFRATSRQESSLGSFGFTGEDDEEVPRDQASTMVNRAVIEGVAVDPDRTRVVTRSDGSVFESIVVGDETWVRYAGDEDELADRKWTDTGFFDEAFEEEPSDGLFGGFGGFFAFASDQESDVGGLTRLLDRTVAPSVVSRNGDETVVRAGLDPRDEEPSEVTERHQGTLEITLADDGRPVRSVVEQSIEVEGGDEFPSFRSDSRLEQEFSAWGEPVDVEAPAEADVDRTPNIEEESIADFDDAPLLQPRGIPEGWVLDYADLVPADESDDGCEQVELDYIDPDDESYGYLYLYESASDCADTDAPPDSEPFTAGANRGWIESYDDEFTYAQIVVGGTVITVDTDLSPQSLARVLGQLRALDFSIEPDPIAGLESAVGTPS